MTFQNFLRSLEVMITKVGYDDDDLWMSLKMILHTKLDMLSKLCKTKDLFRLVRVNIN